MGCHTWFGRPVTEKEIRALVPLAYEQLERYRKDPDFPLDEECYQEWKTDVDNRVISAICSLGSGENFIYMIKGRPYLDCATIHEWGPFEASEEHYHDLFRIHTYPEKIIIRSKRHLRKYLKARWYSLITPEISNKLSQFWKQNPGGVIHFG